MLVKFSKLQSMLFKFILLVLSKIGRLCGWAVISYFTLQIYPTILRYQSAT
ncbi:hypothetical protein ENHY17A_10076 [Moraxellaceae bacterium 17A]|nr:hypothetical protein ENHY17A_10076 [Moraxellaceae bacterium 17A]